MKKVIPWIAAAVIVIGAISVACFMSNERKETSINPSESDPDTPAIVAEGTFDNVMGYSGHYVYYEGHPAEGYYYADDGTLLAYVWGTLPEEVGMVDLDGDSKNELIAQVEWMDGGEDVIVYKEYENGIRYASCSELLEESYDNYGIGALQIEYLKATNEVTIEYWREDEQRYRVATYSISCYPLTWWPPIWLNTATQEEDAENEVAARTFWGDPRDWTCGTIAEITKGTAQGTVISISLKYYVGAKDSEMIEKLGLTEDDFPSGISIEPVGDTKIYPLSDNCEFIFIDWSHDFENDSRVKKYDDVHISTNDFAVFEEYLATFKTLKWQVFFYDIQDGKIVAIYETWAP